MAFEIKVSEGELVSTPTSQLEAAAQSVVDKVEGVKKARHILADKSVLGKEMLTRDGHLECRLKGVSDGDVSTLKVLIAMVDSYVRAEGLDARDSYHVDGVSLFSSLSVKESVLEGIRNQQKALSDSVGTGTSRAAARR